MRIAINGAGIAGPTLAFWLKQKGFEPVLFEKSPQLRRGGHIIDFWGSGYDVAERMGLLSAIHERGYVMRELRSVAPDGHITSSVGMDTFAELTNGRFVSIKRSDLSELIYNRCTDLGIETRFGTSITAINQNDQRVNVTLNDDATENFDLVIGADGLHSAVRSLAFGPEDEFEHPMDMSVCVFTTRNYQPRDELVFVSCTTPRRQINRATLRDDQTLFMLIARNDLIGDLPHDETAQKAAIRSAFADMGWETESILKRMDTSTDFYFDSVSQIHMPHWSRGRVMLLGDAAACASLLAGEGSGLAMTEAYMLAHELTAAHGDHENAFFSYEQSMRPYLKDKQTGANRFSGFFAPKSQLALIIRDQLTRLTAIPALAKLILRGSLTNTFQLPDA